MAEYTLAYTGEQVDQGIGNALKAVITDSQQLTNTQKNQVLTNIGLNTLDLNGQIENLLPNNVTVLINNFLRFGPVCLFVYQINVTQEYSGDYGFNLATLPFSSMMRVWLNNATSFYIDESQNKIRVNNDRISAGNYTINGTYFTSDA